MKIFEQLEARRAWQPEEQAILDAVRRLADEMIAPNAAAPWDLAYRLGLGYPDGPIEQVQRRGGLAYHYAVTAALFSVTGAAGYAPARRPGGKPARGPQPRWGIMMMAAKVATLSAEDAERLRAYERRRHDALAETYRDFFAPVTAFAIEPLLAAVELEPGTELLDVATGGGLLAAAAARRGAKVVGIDLSPGMLEQAKKLHPRIDFRVGEVEHLPFADASFDAVVCSFGLGHFPCPEASVAECVRVLRPGGRIALSWWADSSQQRIQGLFREAIAEVGAEPPPDLPKGHSSLRFCDTGELLRLLQGARLAEVTIADYRTTHLVPDVDTLWRGGLGSLVMATAAIACQDEPTQAAIRAALQRRAGAYQTPDGLELPVAFRIGTGRKPKVQRS